ncbi:MAG: thymidine phosphorylase [Planctomycetaceae bacterium]|nr:thymidine phosphorylase [Planctomycetaceae bacterium]|tara:strand:- start:10447 stop:11760 length:1314 start_codon:yes stop_codon:yes gene_type:complete
MKMHATEIIAKKRDAERLSTDEICWIVNAFVSGKVPDYQMAAFSMAICIQGMHEEEVYALSMAMLESGTTLEWPTDTRPLIDKHSTGGVGDKVSLVLAPLLACCDLRVPMISGRGLGITGGTLDKLESIPGFRTDLSLAQMQQQVQDVGCTITGTSSQIAPADQRWYTLRDVTATVPSLALITSSIMCKKLAEGLDALVLDVKCGSGTSMQTAEDARRLASSMAHLGQKMGVTTSALISNMDQPLGKMLGNAVEVNEAVDILEGKGPDSVRAITIALGCEALLAAKIESETEAAKTRLASLLDSGQAREKFSNMVTSQGGDLDAPRKVAKSLVLCSKQSGFVHAIHAGTLGRSVVQLGGGRQTLGGAIDRSVGIELCVEVGDAVDAGQELVRIFASSPPEQPWIDTLYDAIEINPQSSKVPPLIIDRVTSDGHPIQD